VTNRSRPHLLLAVICVLALAGLGAACGSSSSSNNNTTNSTSSGGGGGGTTSTSGPISTSSGGGLSDSQFCSLAKKWSASEAKQVTALTNPSNLKTFYTTLAKEYQQVIQAAPSEIKPDLNVLIGVFNKFYVVLQQSDFNFQKAEPKLAGLASSFNSAQVKQATAHLDQWAHANNCVINKTSGG